MLTQSGYGVHSVQVARWLLSKPDLDVKFQPVPWGVTPWHVDRSALDGLVGAVIDRSVSSEPTGFDVSVQLQLPNEWSVNAAKINVGMTAAVESDICNPEWRTNCANMSMVIVPSQHAKKSLGVESIKIVPEAYAEECAQEVQQSAVEKFKFSTPFNFLVFGQLTGNNQFNDRKNLFFTLKWLFEEFGKDEDVGVILKTNFGRNTVFDRDQVISNVNSVIGATRKSNFPRLHLIHGELSNSEVAALYKHPNVKALLSATRGEGFGLPLLEAAAAELPVIVTGWSGHMDFLSKGKFIKLNYDIKPVHETKIDEKIFVKGSSWAEVNEQDFKQKVRKFRDRPQIPMEWSKELGKIIQKEYSLAAIFKLYDEAFKGILT